MTLESQKGKGLALLPIIGIASVFLEDISQWLVSRSCRFVPQGTHWTICCAAIVLEAYEQDM
jgi:hypothetical protein